MSNRIGRVIKFVEKGKVEIQDWPYASPEPGQVLIENVRSLVSAGTELSRLYDFHTKHQPFPCNTGYLSCGRVLEIGEGVEGIEEGGLYVAGFGHLSHLCITPDRLTKVPDGLSAEEAVFTSIACISLRAIRQANIQIGDSVLITGLGLIGQLAQSFARINGAHPVVGVDFSPRRLDIAKKSGLKYALNGADADFEDQLKAIVSDGKFNVTIDSTGTPGAVAGLPARTQDGGIVIILGGVHKKVEWDFYTDFQKRNLRMAGAGYPDKHNWPHDTEEANKDTVLRLLKDGLLNVRHFLTHEVGLEEAPEMYRMLQEEKDKGMGVVFKWDE